MKKKKNKNGFGTHEFLTVVVVCLILASILFVVILKNSNQETFQVFRYNAKIVGMNAVNYDMGQEKNIVYLVDMIEDDLISPIKNPFSGESLCDAYESKVEFAEDGKLVTLKCGSYLIDKQKMTDEKIPIYEVSEWTPDKVKDGETKKAYNCIKDNKNLLNDYYEQPLFLSMIGKKNEKVYKSLEDVKNDCTLSEKILYRSKKEIKKISY